MRCPECNTEVNEKRKYCPNCGAPMPQENKGKETKEDLKLSRGMMIFIVVGLALLIAIGVTYNMIHAEDPEYVRTQIDPDSNLMEKNGPTFDTVAIDVQKRDSIKKAENLEAEKLLNSIRKKKQETTESTDGEQSGESGEEQSSTSSESESSASTEQAKPSTPTTPKPSVEAIEME